MELMATCLDRLLKKIRGPFPESIVCKMTVSVSGWGFLSLLSPLFLRHFSLPHTPFFFFYIVYELLSLFLPIFHTNLSPSLSSPDSKGSGLSEEQASGHPQRYIRTYIHIMLPPHTNTLPSTEISLQWCTYCTSIVLLRTVLKQGPSSQLDL